MYMAYKALFSEADASSFQHTTSDDARAEGDIPEAILYKCLDEKDDECEESAGNESW
jgi:hypothetical protein